MRYRCEANPFLLLPLIVSLAVLSGLAISAVAGGIVVASPLRVATLAFSNQTDAAGVAMIHSPPVHVDARMTPGAASGDFNNDGWQDLFVVGGGRRADALFINRGDGTFQDKAVQAGVAELHFGSGVAVGDYNRDGWLDIVVTSYGPPDAPAPGHHRLFRNNGDLTFTDVASAAGVNQTTTVVEDAGGAAFGDYDLDGDLDLFIANWRRKSLGNRLFRNNGDGTFSDVTDAAGIVNDGIRGFSPCFADMDGDRFPELLLSADFGTIRYWINDGDGTFTEATFQALGDDKAFNAMGSTVADVNNDGLLDWFVTNIYDDEQAGRGLGNTLHYNQGNHVFINGAKAAGVADSGWAWGSVIVDLDHDSLLDIVVTNGWHLPAYSNELSNVFANNGDGTFTDVAAATGFDHTFFGRGLAHFDYDNDGDQDIVVTATKEPLRLYRNDLNGSGANWIRVFLDTSPVPSLAPNGFGSRVVVRIGGQRYYRDVVGCDDYLSQSELSAHFGLGAAEVVDELRVEWANGMVTVLNDVDVNQTLTINPYMVVQYSVDLPDGDSLTDEPGQVATYTLTLTNTGNVADRYTLTGTVAGQNWSADWPATVGPVDGGRSAQFDVAVQIPPAAASGDWSRATITATSQGDSSKSDAALLATYALAGVRRGVLVVPVSSTVTTDPGNTTSLTLHITNTGNVADRYTLTGAVTGQSWSTDWPETVGPVHDGSSAQLAVTVQIPPTAAAGEWSQTTITVTSHGDSTKSGTAVLTTHTFAGFRRGVQVTPISSTIAGDPGDTVCLTLHITNTGNAIDTITVSSPALLDWDFAFTPPFPYELPPGGSISVQVCTRIPFGTRRGDSQGGTFVVSSLADPGETAATELTVRVAWREIYLPMILRSGSSVLWLAPHPFP